MATGDLVVQIADKATLDKTYDLVARLNAQLFNPAAIDWAAYFASRATGEIFTTKAFDASYGISTNAEKLNESENLVCVPSTETVKGRDDFAKYNAFWWVHCNYIVDDNGVKIPTAIEGQAEFSRTGKVDVGTLTPPVYIGISIDEDGRNYHYSDSPHPERPELNLVLAPWCKDNKGNPMPYGIVPTYYATKADDGKLYGASQSPVFNFVSYVSLHAEMVKKGAGYVGAGSERTCYLYWFNMIKYGKTSSQVMFRGNTDNNFQYASAEAVDSANYVILTNDQAAKFYIGETVSIGESGTNTNLDRGNSYMRNLADKVRITAIESHSDTHKKVYVDSEAFAVTTTTYISTMPLHSGQTDNILGSDGYVANDGKHSYRIQGVEDGIGAYSVSGNEICYKDTSSHVILYNRNGGDYSADLATIQANWKKVAEFENPNGYGDIWIGRVFIDTDTGSVLVEEIGTGSAVGVGDMCYFGGDNTGLREKLERGFLWNGASAGVLCLSLGNGPSSARWNYAVCVS